jgi:transketolase
MTADVRALEIEAAHARLSVLRMVRAAKSAHLGGALSCIDIVVALYFRSMRIDPQHTKAPDRDRFILSAGHKALAQYAVLQRRGFFAEELLDSYGAIASSLAGHPDMHKLAGIEANTGALGHGLSIGCGMALGLRLDGAGGRVFVVLGDGELPEGSNWEGASIAAHHHLDNLVAFVDVNDLQISGRTEEVMNMEPIADKFAAFGWAVETIDGNDMRQVTDALDDIPFATGKPTAIIARTTKAKGVSFLEGTVGSHYWRPQGSDLDAAEAELRELLAELTMMPAGSV